jgi:hypothetical protein
MATRKPIDVRGHVADILVEQNRLERKVARGEGCVKRHVDFLKALATKTDPETAKAINAHLRAGPANEAESG